MEIKKIKKNIKNKIKIESKKYRKIKKDLRYNVIWI